MNKQRLSKVLAAAGIASRRACEALIFQGLVEVNGETVQTPQTLVNPAEDRITLRDRPVEPIEDKVYYLLNKPAGYVCSARRRAREKLVLDLFAEEGSRLFTVGRLDKETEGLLIVTNDGQFANQIIHPSSNVHKEYLVKTDQELTSEHLKTLSRGTLVEGARIQPIRVEKVRRGTLKIVIGEGRKREVRTLLASAHLKVESLKRIRLGGLRLGGLPSGAWRPLSEREKHLLLNEKN